MNNIIYNTKLNGNFKIYNTIGGEIMKKSIILVFSILIITVFILNSNNYKNRESYNLHGSFSSENGKDWISFNKENNLYAYYTNGSEGQIEYKGNFAYNDSNEYKIKDGFLKDYTVEVYRKYIILRNKSVSERFIKSSNLPVYIIKE